MISLKEYLVLYLITVMGTFFYHKGGIDDEMSKVTNKKIRYSFGSIVYLTTISIIAGVFNNFLVVGIYVVFLSLLRHYA